MLRVTPRHKRLASGGTGFLVGLLLMLLLPTGASAFQSSTADRYSIVHGCYALQSAATSKYVTKSGGAYQASAGGLGAAEPFRMQATALGRYLFYDTDEQFMAVDGQGVSADPKPSNAADWTVKKPAGTFEVVNTWEKRELGTSGDDLTATGSVAGDAGQFNMVEAQGCPKYPEITTNVKGAPTQTFPRYREASGELEGHMHHMAFRFLGGAHCGRPWHRFGVAYALKDCPDHEPDGCAAVLENVLYGEPARCHDTTGWPEFTDWPDPKSLTHEQSYYKWIERSWRSGLRVFVNLMVQNRALCEIYPIKGSNTECDDTKTVEIELNEAYRLQDYIDAQAGGPGEGFYRIVKNPFQARKVINDGKLAVVLGMEVSEPFGCRMWQGVPTCDQDQIGDQIDHLYSRGVRQMEITNKFDNALTGVAGDNGSTGTLVNFGNFYATGRFWDLDTCQGDPEEHDHSPTGLELHNDDLILANVIQEYIPAGVAPVYPEGPLCNTLGLTELGEFTIRRMAQKGMIFDPDHMSVKGRDAALNLVESLDYPGVISSHSWSTPAALPRIYKLGGIVTPYAGDSEGFVDKWKDARTAYRGRQYFGIGYGADQNGFGGQGGPRGADVSNPVTYPFKSADGNQTIYQQRSGERVYDINTDGVAHYGLYPDWIEDLRQIQGNQIIRDMDRGAEAYLQMWERAEGVPEVKCKTWKGAFTRKGLSRGALKVGAGTKETLYSAGQPVSRERTWKWCTRFKKGGNPRKLSKKRAVNAVFSTRGTLEMIGSSLPKNTAGGVGRGDSARALKGKARKVRGGLYVEKSPRGNAFLWSVKKGHVKWTGLAAADVASSNRSLRSYTKRLGL
jgi:microsomal dipeptidase-like Zn-dependent dipeptidase